ncbi:MAG: ATP-binding protein [Oscillatoriales cyanobacterium RM1_1_9]|nr:ATP-binding protein [Oscillatoriales cyanobacterium SM2_3_0]NJO47455.1 ATP-binding protein [Oscillatoriales cyanobacterium RM2_1_1]NJO71385.1 ATP-binding protein [Oscillatoriales cyanobacterium RM1_1_9]
MGAGNQLIMRSHLQVQTSLNELDQVLYWLENLISPLLPEHLLWNCKVVLAEGFTNVVRHAHQSLSEWTPIDVEVSVFPEWVEMRIWDWGQPFNLEDMLESVRQLHTDPLKHEGKRGLIFMSKLTDELSYTRTEDKRNCLTMRKRIRP